MQCLNLWSFEVFGKEGREERWAWQFRNEKGILIKGVKKTIADARAAAKKKGFIMKGQANVTTAKLPNSRILYRTKQFKRAQHV